MKNYRTHTDRNAFSGGWGDCKPIDAKRELMHGLWLVPIMLALFAGVYIMLPA